MKMTVDDRQYRKRMKKLKNVDKPIFRQMSSWSAKTVQRIKRNLRGGVLKVGTGHLWRNVGFKVRSDTKVIKSEIGTGIPPQKTVKYARIQEKGGKIKPKKAKMLTIPLPGIKGKAANYPNSFIIKSKKGNVLIVEKSGKGLRPLFVLKKEVTIPARHWLSGSIAESEPLLRRMMKPEEILKIMENRSV